MTESAFIAVCDLDDLPIGRARAFRVMDTPVALVRTLERVHALHDVCSHADVPLSDGDIVGNTIECWMHGSAFDLTTGCPLTPPAVTPVPVYLTRITQVDDRAVVEVRLTSAAAPADPSSTSLATSRTAPEES